MESIGERIANSKTSLGIAVGALSKERDRLRQFGTMDHPDFVWHQAFPDRHFWSNQAFVDALTRIQVLLTDGFTPSNSMQLLASTRYVFEATVWLRAISADERFGHVYSAQIIKDQIQYYKNMKAHLEQEAEAFKKFDELESRLQDERLKQAQTIGDEQLRARRMATTLDEVSEEVDAVAARTFSIYGYDATFNGYSYQAHLISEKALPVFDGRLAALAEIDSVFEKTAAAEDVVALLGPKRRWVWKDRAVAVSMSAEYNFIYSYTSRLLHATPSSMTTRMQSLDEGEVMGFLRYLIVRVNDLRDLAHARAA